MAIGPDSNDPSTARQRFLNRETDEVYILLDFLSGRADRSLRPTEDEQARSLLHEQQAKATDTGEGDPPEDIKKQRASIEADLRDPTRMLLRTMKIKYPLDENATNFDADAAFLLRARDVLNTRAWPATGATIAFTSMVFKMRLARSRWFSRIFSRQPEPHLDGRIEEVADFAERAYPRLKEEARLLAKSIRFWLNFMVPALIVVLCISAYTAWGKVILDTLDAVRRDAGATEQALESVEANESHVAQGQTGQSQAGQVQPSQMQMGQVRIGQTPVSQTLPQVGDLQFQVHFCDRPRLRPRLIDQALAEHRTLPISPAAGTTATPLFDLSYEPIMQYDSTAQIHVCDRDAEIKLRFAAVYQHLETWENPFRVPSQTASQRFVGISEEQRASSLLAVVGNYILPIFYGSLGAIAFVLRRFHDRLAASILSPRDRRANSIRIALGTLIGACVGLFYAGSSVAETTGILGAAVTLSTSAIAFLAGYGVEGVFTMLESLISQVFRINGNEKPAPATSTTGG